MKTKVNIQRGKSGNYATLTMQILQPSKFGRYLTPIGHIAWQGDDTYQWYAMRFHVDPELSNCAYLLTMYKLACYIKERATSDRPIEIMGIIGGEEHVYDYGMYIPVTDTGKKIYNVKTNESLSVHTRVVAINEIMAARITEGMINRKELDLTTFIVEPVSSRELSYRATDLNYIATDSRINTKF